MKKKSRYQKNKTSTNTNKKQKTIIKRLTQFHILTDFLLEKSSSIKTSSSDFKSLIENRLIEKTETFNYKNQNIFAYKLTQKGKKYAKKQGYTIYTSNSKAHDISHANNVINCYSDKLDFYISEKELREIKGFSRCDGAIIHPSGTILIETITRNYSSEKIESKRQYAQHYDAEQYVEYVEYIEFKS